MKNNFDAKERSARCDAGISCDFIDGWYVLNLKGTNTQIGLQHGLMLAEEISEYIEETKKYVFVCMGIGYDYARSDVQRLIDSTLSDEIREEMTAIAMGVNKILSTNYDVWDIAILNWL
ncbi:MAG TPA: hypothetical protein PKK33_11480, partial [Candidatus Cloacimonadota bacterium]|nr:hypothetical protein [Candidatus Cloacimonadota bacterium]